MLRSLACVLCLTAGLALTAGCDDELSHKENVKVKDDGTVVKEKETVKREPDGTITKEQSKDVSKPHD